MKKTLIISFLLVSSVAPAQTRPGFFENAILGKGKSAPLQLSIDAFPFLFISSGGGGSASVEFDHWQVGAIGFSVVPPDFITNAFFTNAELIKIRRNNAVEVFASYYLRRDRKGIYGGMLGGPEWFVMEDKLTGQRQTITKSYVVPRLGVRVFPVRNLYADASFGWSINVSGTEPNTLGRSVYAATAGGFLYFLQVGVRVNL